MREHPRLIFGLFTGCIVGVLALTFLGGCMSTPDPMNPNRKVSPAQLTQETVGQQQTFDQQAQALQGQRQTILDQYQADADVLKNKYQAAASKLSADTAAYNTAVSGFNQKLQAAAADLQQQATRNEKILQVTAGALQAVGSSAPIGPLSVLGTTLLTSAIGGLVGTWRDSVAKTSTLVVKNQTIQQLAAATPAEQTINALVAGTSGQASGGGTGALVQAPATPQPPAVKLAA